MPPSIKNKLIDQVLQKQKHKFSFFFDDYYLGVKADKIFVRKVLSKLNLRIHNQGDYVMQPGRSFECLYLIYEGRVDVIDSTERFVITSLPSGSFFGDYNILFNVKNNFGFRAGAIQKHTENLPFYSENFSKEEIEKSTMFYIINKDDFMNICH